MFNRNKFRGRVIAEGYTLVYIAAKLDINPTTLNRKMSGESDFTREEIQKLRAILRLTAEETDEIFFADELT